MSGEVGETGSAAVEYGSDRARTSGNVAQGNWLGGIYRCGYQDGKQTGQTGGLSVMGQTGADEETDAGQSEAACSGGAASITLISIPGIFWM